MFRMALGGAAGLLMLAALAEWLTGGLRFQIGPLAVSATQAGRPAVIACTLLILVLLIDQPEGVRGRRRFVAVFLGLLLSLISLSDIRRVGDAAEYVAMGVNLARRSPPSLSGAELSRVGSFFPGDGGFELTMPEYRGHDGRQDFPHFWFYPMLAAPFARIAMAVGAHPIYGFIAVNLLLLFCAVTALWTQLPLAGVLLLSASPILWWVDKAHTEVFTFALLTMAMVWLGSRPWLSLVALGACATQNPPIAGAMLPTLICALHRQGWRDMRVWGGALGGTSLALLHPLYYEARLRLWSGISQGVHWHWPNVREVTTVLWDPNVGMMVHAPIVAAAALAAFALTIRRRPRRLLAVEHLSVLVIGLLFLLSFSQTTNVNSGGTPNPSRYGLWLLPLTVPILSEARAMWTGTIMRVLAGASLAWSVFAFAPRLPDHYLTPTPIAMAVWTHWPSLDNPVAEVFAERVSGREPAPSSAVATAGCEKVLITGDGTYTNWPARCGSTTVPTRCLAAGTSCYANKESRGYSFALAPAGTAPFGGR